MATARHAVRDLAKRAGAPVSDVQLAVSEAVSNAVSHAFRDRPPGQVRVEAWLEAGSLHVVVSDDGDGMRPNLESTGLGLGIMLITKLAENATFDSTDGGTTVTMCFLTPRRDE